MKRVLIFLKNRLLYSLLVLLGLSILIFFISRVVPGDPARVALGPRTPEKIIQQLREEMHLNEPIYRQYYYWLKGVIRGNFGKSLITRRSVKKDIKQFLPATIELTMFSVIFLATVGIVLGSVCALHNNSWIDNLGRIISYIGVVTPSFVFAILLMLIFGYILEIFPTAGRITSGMILPPKVTGLITIDALISGNFVVFWDAIKHLILPAVSLGMAGMAQESRITRSTMCDNAKKDYIIAERSYGIPERIIMFRYLLKPSIIPSISILGLEFGAILGNAFLVELVFNWPGLSRYGMNAILSKDINATSIVVLLIGIFFITGNIIVDIVVNLVDPRISLQNDYGE